LVGLGPIHAAQAKGLATAVAVAPGTGPNQQYNDKGVDGPKDFGIEFPSTKTTARAGRHFFVTFVEQQTPEKCVRKRCIGHFAKKSLTLGGGIGSPTYTNYSHLV
jgi:hypothetical protein